MASTLPGTTVREMVAAAEAEVEALEPGALIRLADDPELQLVDVRDVRELEREGRIPGSFHAPRGMLEFWIAPDSPYHKDVFASGKRFVFYCNKGWRSALAAQTAQRLGLAQVAHLAGGLEAYRAAGGALEPYERKR